MGGAMTGDGEETEEEEDWHPPHVRSPPAVVPSMQTTLHVQQ